jgi:hypothetical protein
MAMKKFAFAAILSASLIGIRLSIPQEIDRLLAAVNGKVITASDIKLTRTLNAVLDLGQNKPAQSEQEELDRLIDQELIRQEMENYPIPQAQVETVVQSKIEYLKNTYVEIGGLPALLHQLGLDEDALVRKIRLIVLSEKFMSLRFGPFITISPAEVEAYYNERLVPDLKKRGYAAPPLAQRASEIEALLKEEKKNAAWLEWIENIRNHSRIEFFNRSSSFFEKSRP